jgi:pimeloyl-ACP methyl ester carboxylesterase
MGVGDVLKRTGVVAGIAAGVVGAVYAGERAAVARIRHRDDPDVDDPLLPRFDDAHAIASHDGGVLYTISRGAGPPVLFAHGVTLSSRVFAKQFDSFPAAGFQAVAFDARGHGESKLGETGHSIENLGEDIRSVIEFLDLRDLILVGHSMGGMGVQSFVVHHPDVAAERVKGIVLESTASRMPMSGARRTRQLVERLSGLTPDAGMFMRQKNLGLLLARVGFGEDPFASHVEATRQMLGACSKETIRDATKALLQLDFTAELPSITIPTLVVVGTHDAITPPSDAHLLAELIPGAELVECEGAGHMLMYERTEEVDALILDFARRCLGGDAGTQDADPDVPRAASAG